MNWKTANDIDKYFLERGYGQPDLTHLRIMAVDEIAIRKGHQFLTVVLDYITGRVVYVGKDRKALDHRCELAGTLEHPALDSFVKMFKRYR